MSQESEDLSAAEDDLVAECVLAFEREGQHGVERALAERPQLAAAARERFDELRAAGLLLPAERHPEQIGPYRVVRHLGSGGMGAVFLAEQTQPVARLVAIKVIRPGMDSQEVLARFAVERQALSLLDHPHVARIFDAGMTADGRPFLVMEHIDGVPLLRYCDRRQLPLVERLQLFARVCEAVQHAHQKGVIHRDLKPSNILVADRDGAAWPVVIDFGVAKAVSGRPGDRRTMTLPGQLLGTPEYMSPEQASNDRDIDTRTDVYSLGVMLFELLTGTLPTRSRELHRGDLVRWRRMLDESDPPTPSSRLTDLGVHGADIAERRATDLSSLRRRLRGDLDWIVLKAIARDRERRYSMPTELAADLQRYLRDEPVLAGPETRRYRLGKFLRRNRLQVGAGAVVFVALVSALVVSAMFFRDARASERAALQQAHRAERNLDRALAATGELLSLGKDPLLDLPHMEPVRRELMERALGLFREIEAIGDMVDARTLWHVADAQRRVGELQLQLGDTAASLANLQAAERRLRSLPPGTIEALAYDRGLCVVGLALSEALAADGQIDALPARLRECVERARRAWEAGPNSEEWRALLLEALLANAQHARTHDRELARQLYVEADALAAPWRRRDAEVTPERRMQAMMVGCAAVRWMAEIGEPAAARERLVEVVRDLDAAVPKTAPRLQQRRFLRVFQYAADLLFDLEDREQALVMLERVRGMVEELVREHPEVVTYQEQLVRLHTNLFMTRNRLGQGAEAQREYDACMAAAERLLAIDAGPNSRLLFASVLVQGAYAVMHHREFGAEVDVARSRTDCERGSVLLAELPEAMRSSIVVQRMEALALHCRAMHHTSAGEVDQAIADYAAAAEILDRLVQDADDVDVFERSLFVKVLRADLLLAQRRFAEAREVYEMAFVALQSLRDRHARPDDWRNKERNVRSSLARVRGLTGDVAGAIELFATLGLDDDDWIGRDFAGRGLLETCLELPKHDARRAELLQRARDVLQVSLDKERARQVGNLMVAVMRSGTLRILAEVEQEAGDWRAAALAWAGVVDGYAAAYRSRKSDRNRVRLVGAMQLQAEALLTVPDVTAARQVGADVAELFAGEDDELIAAAVIAARCAMAEPIPATAASDRECAVDRLLAAIAAGYRDVAALEAMPILQPLLADPRVRQSLPPRRD